MAGKVKGPEGYIRLGSRYISVTFLFGLLTGLLAFIVLYAAVIHPLVLRRRFEMSKTPVFEFDSPYLADYTGKAKLVLADGTLVYEGDVAAAVVEGEGKLYDKNKLIYNGEFVKNEYSGYGKLYEDGVLIYEGTFLEGRREGEGTEFCSGTVVYTGGFSDDVYAGRGKQYDVSGALLYDGEFSEGVYSGTGKRYDVSGALLYDGEFSEGVYSGRGKQYDVSGALLYDGEFSEGTYSGAGKLYGSDGAVLYDGGFSGGMYSGAGKLYRDGTILYEGEFGDGKYNGTGIEYNTVTGHRVFSGKYLEGVRMLAGINYDENGEPVVPENLPVPHPDPLSLLGASYTDAVSQLTNSGLSLKMQAVTDGLFVIDEYFGVVYNFRLQADGAPDYICGIYYYGLMSAGNVVVGADISDAEGGQSILQHLTAPEILVLGYSNVLWGNDATPSKARAMLFNKYGSYSVTAFYMPQDSIVTVSDAFEITQNFAAATEPAGRILFLRIDHFTK